MPGINKQSFRIVGAFVGLIAVTAAIIGIVGFIGGQRAVVNLTQQLQAQIFSNVQDQLSVYMELPHDLNRLNRDTILQHPALLDDLEHLCKTWLRQIQAMPRIQNIATGIEQQGNFAGAGRAMDGSYTLALMNRSQDSNYRVFQIDPQIGITEQLTEIPNYDARKRPWYQTAVQAGEATWSPLYVWASGEAIGLTAVLPIIDATGTLLGVQQSAMSLDFISHFLSELSRNGSRKLFLVEPDGLLVATTVAEHLVQTKEEGFERLSVTASSDAFTRAAGDHLARQIENMTGFDTPIYTSLAIEGERWLISASRMKLAQELKWIMVAGFPEAEVMASIHRAQRFVLGLILAASLVAMFLGGIIARQMTSINQRLHTFSLAMEHSPAGIVITDLTGTIEYVNPAMTRISGYTFDEVVGQNSSIVNLLAGGPEEHPKIWEIITSGKEWRGEFSNTRKNGDVFWEAASFSTIFNEKGQATHYLAVKEDISARKAAENELIQARRQAESATQAKSGFLANMSHEIRTPMNGVIGMTSLLLDTALDAAQRSYAETIRSSGETLLALINDILDFSKIEAGRLTLEILDFDLQSLIDDVAAALALPAQEKGLEFIAHLDPDVPYLLRGDPGRLRQILTNLVGNAVKFTAAGEVVVRVCRVVKDECGMVSDDASRNVRSQFSDLNSSASEVLLRFCVKDTGIGIPEDKNSLLFKKFSQVDASITRQFGGTGLGLAISRQLVEMMGGEVGVNSTLGQGTEFWFTARFAIQEAANTVATAQIEDLAGLHVLVVDDNATSLEILMKQLTAWGIKPQGAADGETALQIAAAAHDTGAPFDLAVVDFQMPGMDGEELGKRFKADARFQAIPLVMLTSLGRPSEARRCADLGFSAYLNKPVRQSELYDTLALIMADTHQRTPAQTITTRHLARKNQRRQAALPRFSGRVLVADDNPVNQQVALGILRKFGLRADAVANGIEALHALQTLPYDLVLMDVMMPEMDGLEATREIRKAEGGTATTSDFHPSSPQVSGLIPHSLKRLPIIAMTAGAMEQDRIRCLEAGMDDYVSKPVNLTALVRVLEKWLPEDKIRKAIDEAQEPENVEKGISSIRQPEVFQGSEGESRGNGLSRKHDTPPVFDRVRLLHHLMDDEKLLREILSQTLDTMPQHLQELQTALDTADVTATHLKAHTIKGMAANIGAEALQHLAGDMEHASQAEDIEAVRMRMGELEAQFARLEQALLSCLAESDRPSETPFGLK